MRQLGIVLVFGLGVGVGCAAGTAVQTPVAEAQPAGAQRWGGRCERFAGIQAASGIGSRRGKEWWEPFSVGVRAGTDFMCFERPLP